MIEWTYDCDYTEAYTTIGCINLNISEYTGEVFTMHTRLEGYKYLKAKVMTEAQEEAVEIIRELLEGALKVLNTEDIQDNLF